MRRDDFGSKRHIVFCVHRFYPEVASTAQIMTELVQGLERRYRITVIAIEPQDFVSSAPGTAQFGPDVTIIRLRLGRVNKNSRVSRMKHLFHYFILAVWTTLRVKGIDALFVISQPPIVGGLIGTVVSRARRIRLVYNVQDFNPEQTAVVSYMRNRVVLGAAKLLDNLACIQAESLILVGRDMTETLEKRGIRSKVSRVSVINNWADEQFIVPLNKAVPEVMSLRRAWGVHEKFVVMYSGNLGLYYDLEGILREIARRGWPTDMVFLFVGDGVVKTQMEKIATEMDMGDLVVFEPFQDHARLNHSLAVADVHLVVNQRGIKGVSVPSKIYGVMAAGRPVIGVLERGSEARLLIEEARCGFCCEPGEYDMMERHILAAYQMRATDLAEFGLNGRQYLEQSMSKEGSIELYHREIEGLFSRDALVLVDSSSLTT